MVNFIEVNICLALMVRSLLYWSIFGTWLCTLQENTMLFQLNHMTIFLGYYLSPCNLWTIHDEKNFIAVCQLLSTLQLGTGIAAFLWVFRRALYFQMKAAKVEK